MIKQQVDVVLVVDRNDDVFFLISAFLELDLQYVENQNVVGLFVIFLLLNRRPIVFLEAEPPVDDDSYSAACLVEVLNDVQVLDLKVEQIVKGG